jgi:oligopeptide transport system permease protein
VAKDWQREVGVPTRRPPSWARRRRRRRAIEVPTGPTPTSVDVDPLAPRYKEWDERAAQFQTTETKKAETLPLGADRLGRDVLAKAIKGTEISVFVGVLAAVVATLIGTCWAPSAASSAARSATSSSGCTTSSRASPASC